MMYKSFSIFPPFLGVPRYDVYSFQYISTLDDMTAPGTQTLQAQKDHFIKKNILFTSSIVCFSINCFLSICNVHLSTLNRMSQ